jgi:hypothetical protein
MSCDPEEHVRRLAQAAVVRVPSAANRAGEGGRRSTLFARSRCCLVQTAVQLIEAARLAQAVVRSGLKTAFAVNGVAHAQARLLIGEYFQRVQRANDLAKRPLADWLIEGG